jgi:LTXXQ motif family protein
MTTTMLTAAAIVVAAAIGVPVLAWSQTPAPPSTASAGPGGPGGPGHGPMGREGMARRWGMTNRSPQQACVDRLARRAGFVAAMGFKLNLTADQKPLWDKVLAATEAAQDGQRKLCAALPASAEDRGKETVIDRMNHRQQMLQAQLQALQQTEPAVQALYEKLTPEQKAMVDRPFRRG